MLSLSTYQLGIITSTTILPFIIGILIFNYLGKKSKECDTPDKFWFKKGLEFSVFNENEKSLDAYNKALTFNDKNPDTWNNKSYVLIQLKKYDEAIKSARIAVDLSPNDPEIQDTLNKAYKASKNQE